MVYAPCDIKKLRFFPYSKWDSVSKMRLCLNKTSRGRNLNELLDRLNVNAKVATVLGSMPASSDTQWNLRGEADKVYLKSKKKT